MKLEKIVKFRPAYQKFHDDPKKNFGIGCVRCFMVLKGKKGAVHFTFGTGMYLPVTYEGWKNKGENPLMIMGTPYMGYDVGYHAVNKQWEGQKINHPTRMVSPKNKDLDPREYLKKVKFVKVGKKAPNCIWLGVPCYSDGSAMRAEEYMKIFVEKGDEAIWKLLEEEYKSLK